MTDILYGFTAGLLIGGSLHYAIHLIKRAHRFARQP